MMINNIIIFNYYIIEFNINIVSSTSLHTVLIYSLLYYIIDKLVGHFDGWNYMCKVCVINMID